MDVIAEPEWSSKATIPTAPPSPTGLYNLWIVARTPTSNNLQVSVECTAIDSTVFVGTTEPLVGTELKFTKPLLLEFWFEEVQNIKFTVEQASANTSTSVLGSETLVLGAIVASKTGQTFPIPNTTISLQVFVEPVLSKQEDIMLQLKAKDLDSTCKNSSPPNSGSIRLSFCYLVFLPSDGRVSILFFVESALCDV